MWLHQGGGIYAGSSQSIIANNLIIDNAAVYEGGGIDGASGYINNNTIDGNSGASRGGGIYISGSTCQVRNNIVINSDSGGGIRCGVSPLNLSNNDVWNNNGGNFDCGGYGDTTQLNRNGIPCDDYYNIMDDPDFVSGYHLSNPSCCKNAGDEVTPFIPTFDFDGNPRIKDGFVDMGAYEYQSGAKGGNAKIASSDTNSNNLHLPITTPIEFGLSQSYPNPFNPTAVIEFTIGSEHPSSHITLRVYNITGQLVKTIVDEEKTPGTYTVTWDGRNNSNEEVASGIYFYELKSKNLRETKRMVLIK
jgi:hypothetical protein